MDLKGYILEMLHNAVSNGYPQWKADPNEVAIDLWLNADIPTELTVPELESMVRELQEEYNV